MSKLKKFFINFSSLSTVCISVRVSKLEQSTDNRRKTENNRKNEIFFSISVKRTYQIICLDQVSWLLVNAFKNYSCFYFCIDLLKETLEIEKHQLTEWP